MHLNYDTIKCFEKINCSQCDSFPAHYYIFVLRIFICLLINAHVLINLHLPPLMIELSDDSKTSLCNLLIIIFFDDKTPYFELTL